MTKISIIIPVLNEAEIIEALLVYLKKNISSNNQTEIIVVDGGSTDGTQAIINKNTSSVTIENSQTGLDCARPDIRIINSEKGRATQMNVGAKYAKGGILYFLHADSFPPEHFDDCIISEINKNNFAGCFKMKFNSKHWWLQLMSWFTHYNWKACRGGDQSLFITKQLFNDIGGYDEDYIIYEDNILINELYKRKQFVVIQKWLISSARLYERIGVCKLQYYFLTIYIKRWRGASAEDLYEYYKKRIAP